MTVKNLTIAEDQELMVLNHKLISCGLTKDQNARRLELGMQVPTWDVEMENKTGHTCHVFVMADTREDANDVAQRQFPELSLTMNTCEAY